MLYGISFIDFKFTTSNYSGIVEAWWAHNLPVLGSKLGSDINILLVSFLVR